MAETLVAAEGTASSSLASGRVVAASTPFTGSAGGVPATMTLIPEVSAFAEGIASRLSAVGHKASSPSWCPNSRACLGGTSVSRLAASDPKMVRLPSIVSCPLSAV